MSNVTTGSRKVHRPGAKNSFDQTTAKCGGVMPQRLFRTDAEANCKGCDDALLAERNAPTAERIAELHPAATKPLSKRAELIAAVRAHAVENYHRGGWDVIVEAFDDAQISEVIGRARTLKGALKKFAAVNSVIADRRSEHDAEIRAAVGTPSASADDHYRVGGDYTWQRPGCACGREFASDKAADLHVVAIQQAAGTYEPTQQGHHPDGSFVSWKHDEHSGDAWATRTWEGKACRASIEILETPESYEVSERYIPAWGGQVIFSADHCDRDDSVPF